MKITKTLVLFYGGPLSQWIPCKFEVNGVLYNCAEQYMMSEKAHHFNDTDVFDKIMGENDPDTQKALGRKVKGFDADTWNRVACGVVYKGNYAKFDQNPDLKKFILETGNRHLVEASPTDILWGIGLSVDDSRALNPKYWRGLNWLGVTLMRVRFALGGLKSLTEDEI